MRVINVHREEGCPIASEETTLGRVTEILDRTLRLVGDRLDYDLACRLAAEAWLALHDASPEEGERMNRTLHYLTARMQRNRRNRVG